MALIPDKQLKKEFIKETSKDPDKYYATKVLREKGFVRKKCDGCGRFFWTADKERVVCDDPGCAGGFRFFENNPAREKLDYVQVWMRFKELFESKGYTAIDRYPVIARWRDDTDFVQASIYDFQPYVVSGEIEPPANPLVVPQFSLRFNDIDNVGVTMSHMTGFIMIGQHAFLPPEEWDQDRFFSDIYDWLTVGLGLPKEEIVFHEDAWAGGGNFGPCMEFFCRGVELGNQVYMMFEQTDEGPRELKIKVLDMGMGQERVAWFTRGEGTIYDAAFPTVMKKLYERTGLKFDPDLIRRYLPLASYLNFDEVDNIDDAWSVVAEKLGVVVDDLKNTIMPLAALYSVAEHSRSLLVALSDGGLPSNTGGGYNLRVILRRALRFIDDYGWDLDLGEIAEWHALYLKELYPELLENLDEVKKILAFEKQKYLETRERNKAIIRKIISKGSVDTEKLLELYDSHGIAPEDLSREAEKEGIVIKVPENFYSLVASRHDSGNKSRTSTKKDVVLDLEGVPPTEALYFDHYDYVDFEARVVKIIDDKYVVLDRTAFYPTSGGQIHDVGLINGFRVVEVFKQATPDGNIIVHVLEEKPSFGEGDKVSGKIDFERRLQLAQHHTATHILTGACRRVLGNHVWQAGASKTVEKSRLDITHYQTLSDEEVKAVESLANQVVNENRPVIKRFMNRALAEKLFGFRLYQGGAVPGKELRIVEIKDFDVEACGGTHLDLTGDVGAIKILKTSKLQDGVVRLEFVAGKAAVKALAHEKAILEEAAVLLDCSENQIPGRVSELFAKWKLARKGKLDSFVWESSEVFEGDVLEEAAKRLKTQPENLIKTIKRFLSDINNKLGSRSSSNNASNK